MTDVLYELWLFDIEVMSQPWMYWLVFPAIAYVMFFVAKWMFITLPVWLPMAMIVGVFKDDSGCDCK